VQSLVNTRYIPNFVGGVKSKQTGVAVLVLYGRDIEKFAYFSEDNRPTSI